MHEEEEITAEHFVLASGSFFSKGLVSEFDKIYEPVFYSDIIGVEGFKDTDRFTWTDHRFGFEEWGRLPQVCDLETMLADVVILGKKIVD